LCSYLSIEGVPREALPLLHVIRCIVLTAGRKPNPAFLPVVPLEALDVLEGVGSGDGGVLPRRLLAAAPARVAKDVDVGRPVREPRLAGAVHAEGLGGYGPGHRAPQRAVEGGGGEDDLREGGGGADGPEEKLTPGPLSASPWRDSDHHW